MSKKVVIILTLIFVILLLGIASVFLKPINPVAKKKSLAIKNQTFEVEVADTALSQSRGLSGKEGLGDSQGMLFIFDRPSNYGFWMKDMKFPIDIIWINRSRIAGFSENLQPEPKKSVFSLPIYYPPESIDKVLEVNAGAVKRYNFSEGDEISISF